MSSVREVPWEKSQSVMLSQVRRTVQVVYIQDNNGRPRTPNSGYNDAPSFDRAKLNERIVEVAQLYRHVCKPQIQELCSKGRVI